jgi:hypothetical protein
MDWTPPITVFFFQFNYDHVALSYSNWEFHYKCHYEKKVRMITKDRLHGIRGLSAAISMIRYTDRYENQSRGPPRQCSVISRRHSAMFGRCSMRLGFGLGSLHGPKQMWLGRTNYRLRSVYHPSRAVSFGPARRDNCRLGAGSLLLCRGSAVPAAIYIHYTDVWTPEPTSEQWRATSGEWHDICTSRGGWHTRAVTVRSL